MRFTVAALDGRRLTGDRVYASMERNMQCGIGHCGHCQLGPTLVCRDGPVYRWSELERLARRSGSCDDDARKPTLAVWKFSSCDGCQLSLLDCEDELLALADRLADRLLPGGAAARPSRAPTTSRIVEGSITTAHDAERIQEVRRSSRALITIGACATAGGIQALRNFADVEDFTSVVYASPDFISTLAHLDADQRPRAGRLRAERLPDQQAPAARGDRRAPRRGAGRACARTACAWSASAAGPCA